MRPFQAIVLAAGQGTRMKSAQPKVLHSLAGLPLVSHVLNAAAAAGAAKAAIVIPPATDAFQSVVAQAPLPADLYVQEERLGTAHAVLMARAYLEQAAGPVLVLYGDTPLIAPESLVNLANTIRDGAGMAVMAFQPKDAQGYGRLITNEAGDLIAIREEKDASPEEKKIGLCNSGIMGFRGDILLSLLEGIGRNNSQQEYYLTDAVAAARARGYKVAVVTTAEDEVRGINTRLQLSEAEAILQKRLRIRAMDGGATFLAPETVTLCADTIIGQDVIIEPNVIFGPGVVIGNGVTIKGFSHIEGAHIGGGAVVGPFARFRRGTNIGANVRIGNFVEIKQADIGKGAKVNHLSYVGDATVGQDANIGAGTIVCNYDGFRKHRTEIGSGAFIGSNSSLVAPVAIGDSAYVGTGSVVTKNVPAGALALARVPQVHRENWAIRYRARHTASRSDGTGAPAARDDKIHPENIEHDVQKDLIPKP